MGVPALSPVWTTACHELGPSEGVPGRAEPKSDTCIKEKTAIRVYTAKCFTFGANLFSHVKRRFLSSLMIIEKLSGTML